MRLTVFALFVCVSALPAQDSEKQLHFTNVNSPRDGQEMMTVLRTVLDFRTVAMSPEAITVQGSPEQLRGAEWLQNELNAPAASVSKLPYNNGDELQILFLKPGADPRHVQELLTILRTVADVQKIFNFTKQSAVVLRSTPEVCRAVAFVAQAVDNPDPQPGRSLQAREMQVKFPKADVVRVYYPQHDVPQEDLMKALTAMRYSHIQKVFNSSQPQAIVMAGMASELAVADSIMADLNGAH